MTRFALLIIGMIMCQIPLWSQDRVAPGEVLLQLENNLHPSDLLPQALQQSAPVWVVQRQVTTAPLNIWLIKVTDPNNSPETLIQWAKRQPGVINAQLNHYVKDRDVALPAEMIQTVPNDPRYFLQWYLNNYGQYGGTPGADIGAEAAWEITTGGLTPAGDTVVVAVIDGGLCPFCDEWEDNLWVNRHEIPNDGIDNDGNGYFDDYRGWNVNEQTDNIIGVSTNHGTAVSGVIGAKGNNNKGISGVMWNTKIQFIAGTSGSMTTEAQILGGFEYVYKSRKRYNETNGALGAFVVAVNCSFGIDFVTPTQFPLWCEMIDQLGSVGILTVAATANGNWDVEEVGDMPSRCTSDYLVIATSLDQYNNKPANAAWGQTSVDLGAYGKDIYTLQSGPPGYTYQTGTSFAAPQVSGAIGLLYTAPCHNLIALAKENPNAGALLAKQHLLNTTLPTPALENITATGGRLHLGQLLTQYENLCQNCPPPYWLTSHHITPQSVHLKWVETIEFTEVDLRWRAVGDTSWQMVDNVSGNYWLYGLQPCTYYEYAVKAYCDAGQASGWSNTHQFKTDGCCHPPTHIWSDTLESNEAVIQWEKITAATQYKVRYKQTSYAYWTDLPETNSDSAYLNNLQTCTAYELQIATHCDTGWTAYSASFFFQTKGCGACYDQTYCNAQAGSAAEEWLQKVTIGNWVHESEGHQPYQNYTGQLTEQLLVLHPNTTMIATLEPGFLGLSYKEMYRIYVDFNLDGDFTDPGETVFKPNFASENPVTDTFSVPDFSGTGITRMRVMMKFKTNNTFFPPQPCESFDYGQVEDYCVVLSPDNVSSSAPPTDNAALRIYPNPARHDFWMSIPGAGQSAYAQLRLIGPTGLVYSEQNLSLQDGLLHGQLPEHLPTGVYQVEVQIPEQGVFRGKLAKIQK